MSNLLSIGRRVQAGFLCCLLVLLCVSSAVGDPKPLSKEDQAKVDAAIDKGVAFLKKAQTKYGDFAWKMDIRYFVGQCALPAYSLLESGVPADDPVIQNAAAYIRPRVPLTDSTYDLSVAILFFDRLGDPKDKELIQGCALRLIAGQHLAGGWAYHCPIINEKNAQDLLKYTADLNKRMEKGSRTRSQALEGLEVPLALQGLTVFQPANRLPWQEPAKSPDATAAYTGRVALEGRTDNSNTQFALLGLWTARRHQVGVDPSLEIAVERFERFHIYPDGLWLYATDTDIGTTSRNSMTCAGLIALAIGRGLKLPTPGSPSGDAKDIHVLRALAILSRHIGQPQGDMRKRVDMEELYFLWSLERVGTLFNLKSINGKDWYRWGAESLVFNQKKTGFWPGAAPDKKVPKIEYGATINTSFALLFLKRSHPMSDLTPKLPFTEKELNEGIAHLRHRDAYPIRTPTSVAPSKNQKP